MTRPKRNHFNCVLVFSFSVWLETGNREEERGEILSI